MNAPLPQQTSSFGKCSDISYLKELNTKGASAHRPRKGKEDSLPLWRWPVQGTSPITPPPNKWEPLPQCRGTAGHEAPTQDRNTALGTRGSVFPQKRSSHGSITCVWNLSPHYKSSLVVLPSGFSSPVQQGLGSCKGHIPVPPMGETHASGCDGEGLFQLTALS